MDARAKVGAPKACGKPTWKMSLDELTEFIKIRCGELNDRLNNPTSADTADALILFGLRIFLRPRDHERDLEAFGGYLLREATLRQIPAPAREALLDNFRLEPKNEGWIYTPTTTRKKKGEKVQKKRTPETHRKILLWLAMKLVAWVHRLDPTSDLYNRPANKDRAESGCSAITKALARVDLGRDEKTIKWYYDEVERNFREARFHESIMRLLRAAESMLLGEPSLNDALMLFSWMVTAFELVPKICVRPEERRQVLWVDIEPLNLGLG
jgi:hypothetical protein